MPYIKFNLKTTSSTFLTGANDQQTEFRSPSIRGQLRFWTRALLGAYTSDLDEVWEQESEIWGSNDRGSQITVRVAGKPYKKDFEARPVPHSRGFKNHAIPPNTEHSIELRTRPGNRVFPEIALQAFSTWILLGGIGKRSRRMFGGTEIRSASASEDFISNEEAIRGWWFNPLRKSEHLGQVIQDHLENWVFSEHVESVNANYAGTQIPTFPTLHPKQCRVVVCHQDYDDAITANKAFFSKLLRSDNYKYKSNKCKFMFGDVKTGKNGKRLASPLIAQTYQIRDSHYMVLTAMRSQFETPYGQRPNWEVIDDFLDDAEKLFHGETVWGDYLTR